MISSRSAQDVFVSRAADTGGTLNKWTRKSLRVGWAPPTAGPPRWAEPTLRRTQSARRTGDFAVRLSRDPRAFLKKGDANLFL
jgi:hypothetical protein